MRSSHGWKRSNYGGGSCCEPAHQASFSTFQPEIHLQDYWLRLWDTENGLSPRALSTAGGGCSKCGVWRLQHICTPPSPFQKQITRYKFTSWAKPWLAKFSLKTNFSFICNTVIVLWPLFLLCLFSIKYSNDPSIAIKKFFKSSTVMLINEMLSTSQV